jgi:branched-subunit amino acid transport protein
VKDPTLFAVGLITLSAGTFAFRLAGPVLRQRISFPPWAERLLETAAVILLAALVVTTGLTEGHHLAGLARPAGVCVGGVLAWSWCWPPRPPPPSCACSGSRRVPPVPVQT